MIFARKDIHNTWIIVRFMDIAGNGLIKKCMHQVGG